MPKLCVNILSPLGLSSTDEAKDILHAWISSLPNLVPERVGKYEPLRTVLRSADLSDALQDWEPPLFLASRRKPRMHCIIFQRGPNSPNNQHSSLKFEFTAAEATELGALVFLESLCEVVEADFAAMEVIGDAYLEHGERSGTVGYLNVKRTSWTFCLSTIGLRKGVPDIYWATVFGKPYVDLFGREQLVKSPALRTKPLTYGGVMLQLTESFADGEQALRPRREEIKRHLNPLAFRGSSQAALHERRPGPFDSPDADSLSQASVFPRFGL